jgi:hypothetical protein
MGCLLCSEYPISPQQSPSVAFAPLAPPALKPHGYYVLPKLMVNQVIRLLTMLKYLIQFVAEGLARGLGNGSELRENPLGTDTRGPFPGHLAETEYRKPQMLLRICR